jgi:hypothetical protein
MHRQKDGKESKMGTRSLTIVFDGDQEVCRIYRQFDGHPNSHGVDLAKVCDVQIVNGVNDRKAKQANGMGCLAARIVAGLKDGVGNIYLEPTGGDANDWCEYIYIVRGKEGSQPTITCSTQPGPWPFNMQTNKHKVFSGTPKAWLKKYAKEKAA